MPTGGWHRADIVAAIHKKGSSLTRLGRASGLADSTLRTALQRPRTPSNRIIARFIGIPMHVLWPAWFDRAGNLVVRRNPARKGGGRRVEKDADFYVDGGER